MHFSKDIERKGLSEFVGTAVLVLVGCGTAIAMGCQGTVGDGAYVGTALAFGLAVTAMAYSVGKVSGCHLNPAVSIAMLVDGRMEAGDCVAYVASQLAGAAAGCLALAGLFGPDCGFGANALVDSSLASDTIMASILVECLLTFVFVFTILGVTSDERDSSAAGIVIGLTLAAVHLVGIRFTGTSVNPARSLLPALFAGGEALEYAWVFVAGPVLGAVLAALCWRVLAPKAEE